MVGVAHFPCEQTDGQRNMEKIIVLDVHGSVHRNIKLIERNNKMQPSSRIYYFNVS